MPPDEPHALVKGYDAFDWSPLEAMLDDIASRGHQAVFRVYLEYLGKRSGIPRFLRDDGLRVTSWSFPETSPPATIATPDYGVRNLEPEATLPAEPARGPGRSRPVADGRRPLAA